MCRTKPDPVLYRLMAVYTDGGVSTRTMGSKADYAVDMFNLVTYGDGHDELLFCTLIEIGASDNGIARRVVKSWSRDHRTADEIEWDNIRYSEMAALEAKQRVAEPA